MKTFILAITGASGALYGVEAMRQLVRQEDIRLYLVLSRWGGDVLTEETGADIQTHIAALDERQRARITLCDPRDMRASISSGSNPVDGMLIAPCSMGTLCSIASGLSGNLIERSAAVTLKERRPLVLLARETPLSTIHLEQMAAVSRAGAVVMPPVPALYLKPESISDMVTHTVSRALGILDKTQPTLQGWNNETD